MSTSFPSFRVEGGLIGPELIDQIAKGQAHGQAPREFNLPDKTKLLDEVSAAWGDARTQWKIFRRRLNDVASTETGATLTRNQWMTPLLDRLGYDLSAQPRAVEIDGLTFAISHRAGAGGTAPPIHIVGARQNLNERAASGRPRLSPHSLVQGYLNSSEALWGVVTNGQTLRLLRNSQRVRRHAYLEFELDTMFEGEHFADFALFYRLLHRTRLPQTDAPAESCHLEGWYSQTIDQGGRVREKLRTGVEHAMLYIANGLLEHPANDVLRAEIRAGRLTAGKLHGQLLRLIYRLLFLMVTEERNLLCYDPVYRENYSIARLRRLCEVQRAQNPYTDLWTGLWSTFRLFHDEDLGKVLQVPPLNGELFDLSRSEDLQSATLANSALLKAFEEISLYRERPADPRQRVNYSALDIEELGSVYESLLDLQPVIPDLQAPRFGFVEGTTRKTTGSYYTPPELVDELVRTALVPVIEDRLRGVATTAEREQRLLAITVCDPACGSGHFLLAAARRLARELAQVRANGDEPSPDEYRRAMRDVVTHSIYGVDRNDLAVELCRVALWLETHVAGKPLSFLDHHIVCGDALVGMRDLAVLKQGIPEGAFKPVTGDDVAVASEMKRRNKAAQKGQRALPFAVEADLRALVADRQELFGPDDSPFQVRGKKKKFDAIRSGRGMQRDEQAADLWTAAFFADLTQDNLKQGRIPDTEAVQNQIEGHDPGLAVCTATELHGRMRFFHWPLEFPEIFARGGFDVVLCNPPWERIKLQQEEFFSTRDPRIALAANAAARKVLIRKLPSANPALAAEYQRALHDAESLGRFLRGSTLYPTTSRGDINTYSVFAERLANLVRAEGRVGAVLPTGIATDDTNKAFFAAAATGGRLASLFDFENRDAIFPGVHRSYKFSLITMLGSSGRATGPAQFAFFLTRAAQLRDQARTFPLLPEDFARINPNTKTCPIFRTRDDADLTRHIYERVPVLVNEATEENPWNVRFSTMFHMSNDAGLFRTREQLEMDGFDLHGNRFVNGKKVYLPLYESKMIHQFDHRFGSFEGIEGRGNTSLPTPDEATYAKADYIALPWYWVAENEVEAALNGWDRQWLIGFRNVTNGTNERTAIFNVVPQCGVGNSMPLIFSSSPAHLLAAFLGNVSSLVFDYVARQKVAGMNMNFFYVQQFPVLPPTAYSPADLLFIVPRVVELTATAWDVQPFLDDVWRDADRELRAAIKRQWQQNRQATGGQPNSPPAWYTPAEDSCPHPPFRWSEQRRARLRAELDAWYARLYGLDERDLRYILDPSDIHGPDFPGETFRGLKKNEIDRYGEYRTQRLVLEAWRALEPSGSAETSGFAEQMQEAARQAHEFSPEPESWGFYAYGDGPADAGGGTGGFLWFATRDQMLDFVKRYLPFWCSGPARSDERAVAAKLRESLASLNGSAITDQALVRLNQVLKGYAQIKWLGKFGEMLSAETPFAKEIRAWFWSNSGRKNGSAPISNHQAPAFSECLQEYGL